MDADKRFSVKMEEQQWKSFQRPKHTRNFAVTSRFPETFGSNPASWVSNTPANLHTGKTDATAHNQVLKEGIGAPSKLVPTHRKAKGYRYSLL